MGLQYYIVDTETNGLKASWNEVTQISIIRCSDRNQLSKYIKIEYPSRTNPEALKVTNRTMADLLKGQSKEEVVKACDDFFAQDDASEEARCLIAHNSSFDKRFCHALWESCGKKLPVNLWLCTMACSKYHLTRKLGIEKPSVKLDSCMDHFGLTKRGISHNAIVDTQNTYILYEHLKKESFDFLPYIKRMPHEAASGPELKDE